MAEGDLVVEDFHLEVRGKLHGPGTGLDWDQDAGGWTGLGHPGTKPGDFDLSAADGVYQSGDFLTERTLTFPVVWHGTQAEVWDELAELTAAWTVSDEPIRLYAQLPGWGRWYVEGMTRGIAEDMSRIASGEGAGLLTFVAGSPTITRVGPVAP